MKKGQNGSKLSEARCLGDERMKNGCLCSKNVWMICLCEDRRRKAFSGLLAIALFPESACTQIKTCRLPGNVGQIKRLCEKFETTENMEFEQVPNPLTVAGFLKKVFIVSYRSIC